VTKVKSHLQKQETNQHPQLPISEAVPSWIPLKDVTGPKKVLNS